jgi:hypothetical protein
MLAVTPAAICLATPMHTEGIACTCVHGDDQACPMHHPLSTPKPCSCRGNSDAGSAAVAALVGSPAVLPHAADSVPLLSVSEVSPRFMSRRADRPRVPDAPPPRA